MKIPGLLTAILLPAYLQAQKPTVKPPVKPNPFTQIDARALQLPDSSSHTVSAIAAYVNANFTTSTEKARAIFIWIAGNIQYDIDNMFAIDFYQDSAAKVARPLQTRKGICENYAALFSAISNEAGVRSLVIEGYTKQRGFVDYIPHAWCAALIDGNWVFIDPTWGSGYVDKGKFVRKVNEDCFKANPEAFIKSHIPFDYLWEFLNYPVTNQEFYEEKTAPDKSKPYFDFRDSIAAYEAMSHIQQETVEAVRVEKNGLRNGMVFDWLRHLKLDIENDRQNRLIDAYNGALQDFNSAVRQFNVFIEYRNQQFKPVKPDPEIQQMLDTVNHVLQTLGTKTSGIVLTPADSRIQQPLQQLKGSIEDLAGKVKEQQDFLTEYFSKGRSGRKAMFYKTTLFGRPIN
ncbi:MAG TPA: transglutaminase domain-containing protein [Puia sp.]|jgi:hypothetical protein|nr:transglutaminase domain-containing protein [Puia sp.]